MKPLFLKKLIRLEISKALKDEDWYVSKKGDAGITFSADSDTDAERQSVDLQAGRPQKIENEGSYFDYLVKKNPCPTCKGSGYAEKVPGKRTPVCSTCKGTGIRSSWNEAIDPSVCSSAPNNEHRPDKFLGREHCKYCGRKLIRRGDKEVAVERNVYEAGEHRAGFGVDSHGKKEKKQWWVWESSEEGHKLVVRSDDKNKAIKLGNVRKKNRAADGIKATYQLQSMYVPTSAEEYQMEGVMIRLKSLLEAYKDFPPKDCPKCGARNLGSPKCQVCGYEYPHKKEGLREADARYCPNCGHWLSKDEQAAGYCDSCDSSITNANERTDNISTDEGINEETYIQKQVLDAVKKAGGTLSLSELPADFVNNHVLVRFAVQNLVDGGRLRYGVKHNTIELPTKESVQEASVWDQVCPKCGKKPPRELRVWSDQSKCPLCSTSYDVKKEGGPGSGPPPGGAKKGTVRTIGQRVSRQGGGTGKVVAVERGRVYVQMDKEIPGLTKLNPKDGKYYLVTHPNNLKTEDAVPTKGKEAMPRTAHDVLPGEWDRLERDKEDYLRQTQTGVKDEVAGPTQCPRCGSRAVNKSETPWKCKKCGHAWEGMKEAADPEEKDWDLADYLRKKQLGTESRMPTLKSLISWKKV